MMQIMIFRIIPKNRLTRIPPQPISTMIVHRLYATDRKEQRRLPGGHEAEEVGAECTEGIEEETFEGVVVEGAEGVGDVETVVD